MAAIPVSALRLLSLEQLQVLQDNALANLTNGFMTVTLSFSGKNVGRQVVVNPGDLLDAVSKELRFRDPATYGYRDTRTTSTFS